jgi:hypothetical protein
MKFLNYLSEAPIIIDLPALKQRIEKIFNINPRNKMGLVDDLNKEFKPDDIDFTVLHVPGQDDTINAFIFPETLEISLEIGIKLLGLSNKELINRIIETLEHELVHKEQLKRSGGKAHTESMENIDASNVDQYLSDKMEIMAYAEQIVTTLRNENYSDSQIIDMIRNPKKWTSKIVKSRSHLEIYMEVFKKDIYQVKRLKKIMIQYIGDTK